MQQFASKMDAFIQEYCRLFHFSGNILVTCRDEVIYRRSFGMADAENGIANTQDTVFNLYSISKPFCAIGLLRLVDKGLVDLDAHPGKYVPEASGFSEKLTIRNMLHHSSGMPDFRHYDHIRHSGWSVRQQVAYLAQQPMLFEPGTDTLYGNINFTLAALVIENVSGMDYYAYMQQEVFAPLGAKTITYRKTQESLDALAQGYDFSEDKYVPVNRSGDPMMGAGDLQGTVEDVFCLNQAIKHKMLLKPETWEEVLSPGPISTFGFGCRITQWHGKHRITHNGGATGFRTLHIQLPDDDLDIIVLSNNGWGNCRSTIPAAIYNAFYGAPRSADSAVEMDAGYIQAVGGSAVLKTKDGVTLPAFAPAFECPEQLVGDYGNFRIEKDGDGVKVIYPSGKVICCYMGDKALMNRYFDEAYPVVQGEDGTVSVFGCKKK